MPWSLNAAFSERTDPATRTRVRAATITQLVLCAIVLGVAALALTNGGPVGRAAFLIGSMMIFAGGAAMLIVPWARLSATWFTVVPLVDIAAIGLMRWAEPMGGFATLWVFPAMWLASVGLAGFIAQAVLIIGLYWLLLATSTQTLWTYGALLLPVVILVVGTTSFFSTRRFVAQQSLLDKQAILLTGALARAQRQEQLVSEVLDAVDFGVIRIGPDGSISVVNEALGRFQRLIPGFGDATRPLEDAYLADGTTPLPSDERPLLRALRGEVFDNQIVWFGAPDQRRWALSMTTRRLRDTDGRDSGCVLIARDVTAEMTALRARDKLVASVSHELRTPLTSVLGYIDLAVDHLDRPDEARRDLDVAAKNGERLLEIVSDILAASSSSRLSMDMTVSPEDTDLAVIVRTAAEAWRARADERAITISVEGIDTAPAYVDPLRIRQVIDNLVSNAVKYNRDGGEVTLGTTTDGESSWVLIRDTGIGISDADQDRLFERFFRARTGVDGTGLGLSISRDIVRAHGGDITVHSASGAGSMFMVRVPVSADAAAVTGGFDAVQEG
ncbi:cell wall metabolism sensor histidine kinase WalK [Microbacterium sp. SORGH_AS_0888]|uniref:sensor histidine kinase n=1 Tax=Microbacterium sp. SORGH_AS_0888 TaxID=3041791 RepID=UPI002785FAB4|nr:PAS domain-containing sensor histidine kinase [Microbacterium sp. SORGH_AS_0888]MDQ1128394.1 signal transduction histidine kinase [Microbacterium sp. SORGH_AS_0888]